MYPKASETVETKKFFFFVFIIKEAREKNFFFVGNESKTERIATDFLCDKYLILHKRVRSFLPRPNSGTVQTTGPRRPKATRPSV
jgi:hypothetical protein